MRRTAIVAGVLLLATVAGAQYRYRLAKYYKTSALNEGTVLVTCLNGVQPRVETMLGMVVVTCVPKPAPHVSAPSGGAK